MSLIPELLCSLVLFTENRIIHHGSEVGSSQWVTPFYQVKSDFYLLGCISQTFQSYTWIGYLSDAGPKSNIRYSKNKLMCSVRRFSNSRANTASRKLTAQGLTVWMYFAPAMQTVSLFFLFSLNRTKKMCVIFFLFIFHLVYRRCVFINLINISFYLSVVGFTARVYVRAGKWGQHTHKWLTKSIDASPRSQTWFSLEKVLKSRLFKCANSI